MEGHGHHHHHHHLPHHHHPQQQQQQQQQPLYHHPQQQVQVQVQHHQLLQAETTTADSRFPQWSIQETKEFLIIRSELDRNFMETKRNKLLWEVISSKMKEKGFLRSPEQCKCKWKNLVTRYKGCETMEGGEGMRQQQFPFYSELQAIFGARMQRMLWAEAAEGATTSSGGSKKRAALSSDEEEEEEEEVEEEQDNEEEEETEEAASQGGEKLGVAAAPSMTTTTRKKKKMKKGKSSSGVVKVESSSRSRNSGGGVVVRAMKEVLEEFMRQQMAMEMQWREAYEARETERRNMEMEWRRTMEALEQERLMLERRWREREDQRRLREEARADNRDALITALLSKLTRDDHHHPTT